MTLPPEGLTVLTPARLEELTQSCPLQQLTVGCLRAQLQLPDVYCVIINGKNITDTTTAIQLTDQVAVLPAIAGG